MTEESKSDSKAMRKEKKEAKRAKREARELRKLRSISGESNATFNAGATSGDESAPQVTEYKSATAVSPEPEVYKQATKVSGASQSSNQVVVKTGSTDKLAFAKKLLILIVLSLLAFIFMQIAIRTATRTTVNKSGMLVAYADPWGLNNEVAQEHPVKVESFEQSMTSLLDLHEMPLSELHKTTSIRFAVKVSNDWVAHMEVIQQATRSMRSHQTTVHFMSGSSIIIDATAAPPLQVIYQEGGVFFEVSMPDTLVPVTSHATACVQCPESMHQEGQSCVCDDGLVFSSNSFGCTAPPPVLAGRGAVSSLATAYTVPENLRSGSACIGNITMYNVKLSNSTTALYNLTFNSHPNAWGTPLGSDGLQANAFYDPQWGGEPRCASNWTFTDGSLQNIPMTGCASLQTYRPKNFAAHSTLINSVTTAGMNDIFWCPRVDSANYVKKFYGSGPILHEDLLFGICVPCSTNAPTITPSPTTMSPTAKPTTAKPTTAMPTSAPTTKAPTTGQPTSKPTTAQPTSPGETYRPSAAPSASPTSSPTSSPTLSPYSSDDWYDANTTEAPTTNWTEAPTVSPSSSPSSSPSASPTRTQCVTVNCQRRAVTYAAAKDFCENMLGLSVCSPLEATQMYEKFRMLLASPSSSLQEAAVQTPAFSCFNGAIAETVFWLAEQNDFACGEGQAAAMFLSDGSTGCLNVLQGASPVCCGRPADQASLTLAMESADETVGDQLTTAQASTTKGSLRKGP